MSRDVIGGLKEVYKFMKERYGARLYIISNYTRVTVVVVGVGLGIVVKYIAIVAITIIIITAIAIAVFKAPLECIILSLEFSKVYL
jgi:hypothetical protein